MLHITSSYLHSPIEIYCSVLTSLVRLGNVLISGNDILRSINKTCFIENGTSPKNDTVLAANETENLKKESSSSIFREKDSSVSAVKEGHVHGKQESVLLADGGQYASEKRESLPSDAKGLTNTDGTKEDSVSDLHLISSSPVDCFCSLSFSEDKVGPIGSIMETGSIPAYGMFLGQTNFDIEKSSSSGVMLPVEPKSETDIPLFLSGIETHDMTSIISPNLLATASHKHVQRRLTTKHDNRGESTRETAELSTLVSDAANKYRHGKSIHDSTLKSARGGNRSSDANDVGSTQNDSFRHSSSLPRNGGTVLSACGSYKSPGVLGEVCAGLYFLFGDKFSKVLS